MNLFGITRDAPKVESFVVFSLDLGGVKGNGRYAPASIKSQALRRAWAASTK